MEPSTKSNIYRINKTWPLLFSTQQEVNLSGSELQEDVRCALCTCWRWLFCPTLGNLSLAWEVPFFLKIIINNNDTTIRRKCNKSNSLLSGFPHLNTDQTAQQQKLLVVFHLSIGKMGKRTPKYRHVYKIQHGGMLHRNSELLSLNPRIQTSLFT